MPNDPNSGGLDRSKPDGVTGNTNPRPANDPNTFGTDAAIIDRTVAKGIQDRRKQHSRTKASGGVPEEPTK